MREGENRNEQRITVEKKEKNREASTSQGVIRNVYLVHTTPRKLAVSLVLIFSAMAPRSRTPTVVQPGGEDSTTVEIAGRVSWTLID